MIAIERMPNRIALAFFSTTKRSALAIVLILLDEEKVTFAPDLFLRTCDRVSHWRSESDGAHVRKPHCEVHSSTHPKLRGTRLSWVAPRPSLAVCSGSGAPRRRASASPAPAPPVRPGQHRRHSHACHRGA